MVVDRLGLGTGESSSNTSGATTNFASAWRADSGQNHSFRALPSLACHRRSDPVLSDYGSNPDTADKVVGAHKSHPVRGLGCHPDLCWHYWRGFVRFE
jgi:hypothetical protein